MQEKMKEMYTNKLEKLGTYIELDEKTILALNIDDLRVKKIMGRIRDPRSTGLDNICFYSRKDNVANFVIGNDYREGSFTNIPLNCRLRLTPLNEAFKYSFKE